MQHLIPLRAKWPHLFDCIDPVRLSEETLVLIEDISTRAPDFDSLSRGGRGELYRSAQLDPLVRSVGISQLFDLASKEQDSRNLTPESKILDTLGGDGVLARAITNLRPPALTPSVLTSDISEGMISAALEYGLFAIRQAAQSLLLKDNCLNGVIIAYGTHHIPRDMRRQVCNEAFRVLNPGGRIVFHDFESGSAMTRWFDDIVDVYSLTGHAFTHFTRQEIKELLTSVEFDDVQVRYLYDPFMLFDESEQRAKRRLAEYLLHMYGLAKLTERHGYDKALDEVYAFACEYFKYDYKSMGLDEGFGASEVRTFESRGMWCVEAPRVAIVGFATKPSKVLDVS